MSRLICFVDWFILYDLVWVYNSSTLTYNNNNSLPFLQSYLYINVLWYIYIHLLELMWLLASLTPGNIWYIFKPTCTPVIFGVIISTMVLTFNQVFIINLSHSIAVMFRTMWFSFTKLLFFQLFQAILWYTTE